MPPFSHTIACENRDFPEWHGGRTHALVWAVELDQPEVRNIVAAARARLQGLLLPRYERQPHVTVAFAGLAAARDKPGYGNEQLAADLVRLQPLLDGPVELRPTEWGSFPMVPYLGVESPWLFQAQAVLDGTTSAAHEMSYVPHVTLGHWSGEWIREDVMKRLDADLPAATWRVAELSLLRYETHDIAGTLEPVGRLDLAGRAWVAIRGLGPN